MKGAGQQWCNSRLGTCLFALRGSNRSGSGGDEAAEASCVEGRLGNFGESVGPDKLARCAGLETGNPGTGQPRIERRMAIFRAGYWLRLSYWNFRLSPVRSTLPMKR